MSTCPRPKIRLDSQQQSFVDKILDEDVVDLYVSNIPNELTKDGLENLFLRAGAIENVKIIPSKIADSLSTYGFVRFRTKTSAMKAIQMFNNYEIKSQNLRVKFAKPQVNGNSASNANGGNRSSFGNTNQQRSKSVASDNEEWEEKEGAEDDNTSKKGISRSVGEYKTSSNKTLDYESRNKAESTSYASLSSSNSTNKRSIGRGQIIKDVKEKYELDTSRPYARRIASRRSSVTSGVFLNGSKSNLSDQIVMKKSSNSKHNSRLDLNKGSKRLNIGSNYNVEITCAFNPSYFYIQTKESLDEIANLMNNMDNCYRNEDEFNDVKDLKIGNLCACHIDNYWYRGQIIAHNNLKYNVRLIDFGDLYELAHDEVTTLKPEFCDVDNHTAAIRCAFAGIKPYKSTEWCADSIEMLKNLINNNSSASGDAKPNLIAKIIDFDFDTENNEICLVQLFVNTENESIVDYYLDEKYAEIVLPKPNDSPISRSISISNNNNKNKPSKLPAVALPKSSSLYSYSIDDNHDNESVDVADDENHSKGQQQQQQQRRNISSVSNNDIFAMNKNQHYQQSTCTLVNTMANGSLRTKLFNCTFKVWKTRDIKRSQAWTCSPKPIEVYITNVFSADRFYIQRESDQESIEIVTKMLQKYANVLLHDEELLHNELFNSMVNTQKFDLVLAKSKKFDKKWKRAIILDVFTVDEFLSQVDIDDETVMNNDNSGYFNVFFIDDGFEELIEYKKCLENFEQRLIDLIVILPYNSNLNQWPPFALKCSLNRSYLKRNILTNTKSNEKYQTEFEIKFRKMFNEKNLEIKRKNNLNLFINIVKCEIYYRNDIEASVELFKIDDNNNKVNLIDLINSQIVLRNDGDEQLTTVKLDVINKRIMNKTNADVITNAKSSNKPPEAKMVVAAVESPPPVVVKTKSKVDTMKYVQLLNVGERYEATVVYVNESKHLFLVEKNQVEQVGKIQEYINTEEFLQTNTSPVAGKLSNGFLVIAFYETDWYRAIVTDKEIRSDNKMKLFFVDYGNEEYIDVEHVRVVNSKGDDDETFHQTFKINCCELTCLDKVLNDKEVVMEKLKELEYKNVIITIPHVYFSISGTKSYLGFLPRYLINLYMDENDESNGEDRLYKTLSGREQQSSLDTSGSKIRLSQYSDAEEVVERKIEKLPAIPKNEFVKLSKNEAYKVAIQFVDDDSGLIYFILNENLEKLENLQNLLQEADDKAFDYVENLTDISTDGQYEALYKEDAKWYRCTINKINKNSVDVYFADYGNLENLDLSQVKLCDYLRKRKMINNDIFKINYQAIKCQYTRPFEKFAEEVAKLIEECADNGAFYIKCVDVLQPIGVYVFDLVNNGNDEDDREVSEILSDKKEQTQIVEYEFDGDFESKIIDLDVDSNKLYDITITSYDSTDEMYVQLNENYTHLVITQQQQLQALMHKLISSGYRSTDKFKVGDYVIADFAFDSNWYRGVVVKIVDNEYEVYYVDFGNKEKVKSSSIFLVNDLYKLVNDQIVSLEDVNLIVNAKFSAILCKLDAVKKCTHNTEMLKTLMSECLTFNMSVASVEKSHVGLVNDENLCLVNHYTIELFSENKFLNDGFIKKEETVIIQQQQQQQEKQEEEAKNEQLFADNDSFEMKLNTFYECKYSVIEDPNEFYIHRIDNDSSLRVLEKYLNDLVTHPDNALRKFSKLPQKDEIVLAKFESQWYRAKIIEARNENSISVFFIDYGNCDENSDLENILEINKKSEYEFVGLPPLAYRVKLNDVKIDVDKHGDLLADVFQQEKVLVKCVEVDKVNKRHIVEIYDKNNNTCFNKIFNPQYGIEIAVDGVRYKKELEIDKTYIVEYLSLDDIDHPIYFILHNEVEKAEKLLVEMNQYYENSSTSVDEIKEERELQIGEYYAAKLSDNNWYRVKIVSMDTRTKLMKCELVDYGSYENDVYYFDRNKYFIKKLNKKHSKEAQYAIKVNLIDLKTSRKMEFKNKQKAAELLGEFIFENMDTRLKKKLKMKVHDAELEKNVKDGRLIDGEYFVELFNDENECLNKLIENESEVTDEFLKVNFKQIPKQQLDLKQTYHTFVQRMDCFYLFDETNVKSVQDEIQNLCSSLQNENRKFNYQTNKNLNNLPEVGNLVYARYDDDTFWYRCMITNKSNTFDKFELFFIDFGNTEIVSVDDILLPYEEKHVECFLKYPAQAFKSKLYGFKTSTINEASNEAFKNYVLNKEFHVKVIKKWLDSNNNNNFNEIYFHEVQLIQTKTNQDVHSYLIDNNHAGFDTLEIILKGIKTNEEIEFYKDRFNLQKKKLGL